MGHEHHFLSRLDRVSAPHVELALELYRDHELVRFIMDGADLPAGAERVAVSLDDPREGPFLIVTREGRFVTCLGRGMRAGEHPVITRVQLDGRMARAEVHRAQREERRKLLEHGDAVGALLMRILDAGDEVSREDLSSIAALQPLLIPRFLRMQIDISRQVFEARASIVRLLKRTARLKPSLYPGVRAYWRLFWGMTHLTVLCAMGGPEVFDDYPDIPADIFVSLGTSTIGQAIVAPALRGVWAMAKLGKTLLPEYKRKYDTAATYFELLEAVLVTAALGLRHSRLRAEARKTLTTLPTHCAPFLVKHAGPLMKLAAKVLDAPDELMAAHRGHGAQVIVSWTSGLPAGSPLRYDRPEDVPEELAMTAAAQERSEFVRGGRGLLNMAVYLPWVARASAEQLYLPRDLLRVIHVPWQVEHGLELARGWYEMEKAQPRKRPEGPARKGPCPCGSGKKYKHCCEEKEEAGGEQ